MIRDSRIPVLFATLTDLNTGDQPLCPGDALLLALDATAPAVPGLAERVVMRLPARQSRHPRGCNCCVPQTAAMQAMAVLFHRRARGEVAFFRRLVVALDPAPASLLRAAMSEDRFVAARYRDATAAISAGGFSRTSPDRAAEPGSPEPASD